MLFMIHINDLPETVRSDVYLFADDTKIFKKLNSENDKDILQSDLTNLMDWSEKWLLSFHPDKCKHVHITRERGDPTDITSLAPDPWNGVWGRCIYGFSSSA